MINEELLMKIASRCTSGAWEALKTMEGEPTYRAILEILNKKQGAILEYDVGRARNEVENSEASARQGLLIKNGSE
jgi:hypothetical protein